ncbi:MAG: riboflavin synthase [Candidatus Omnitrophota bacterium]|nr:riboflavin synthase [Candidatus Omnitrophota bacterium]
MFTGIIEEVGKVKETAGKKGVLVLETRFPDLRAGESVAVNGVCLTVSRTEKGLASFDLSPETLKKTGLGRLKIGRPVNLERALRLGDRVGGHLVTGHIDGKGKIMAVRKTGPGKEVTILFPAEIKKYLAVKGSVAIEGISLTVAGLSGNRLSVALVPYTLNKTNLGEKRVGDEVNLEVDIIARYLK